MTKRTTRTAGITQRECNDLADQLARIAKLLRTKGAEAVALAADWDGEGQAANTDPGSRSTEHNDLSRRVVGNNGLRVDPQWHGAHGRMLADISAIRTCANQLLPDLTFCQRARRTTDKASNTLARLNSKRGECEACFTAGRNDSWRDGDLEAVTISRVTVDPGADVTHDQLDLCRRCAVSCRDDRARATKAGTPWDHDEWLAKRIAWLAAQPQPTDAA